MKSKAWLSVFAVISLLLIGGAAFFCFNTSQAYSTSRQSWDTKVGTVKSLEGRPLYPDSTNVKLVKDKVAEYDESVENLYKSLNEQFQKPLNKTLANIDFVEVVKTKVTDFRKHAGDSNFVLNLEEDFQLGFDAYSNSVPNPKIVPILDFELQAIDYLLRQIIASGAESMDFFSRDLIAGEVGGPEKTDSGVVQKYPVRVGFVTSHSGFENLINNISNGKEFFYILRVLKVTNEQPEGPLRDDGTDSDQTKFENPNTREVASGDLMEQWGWPDASLEDLTEKAAAAGFVPSGTDARVLMGQEKLEVFMVVDIVRFLDPSEVDSDSSGR